VEALPHFTRIALNPLSAAASALVIRAKLAQLLPERAGTASQALIARVTEKAQGNPFYVEELLNYLHDRGIDLHDAPAIDALDLPSSLHTLILSRIDQLGARQQATLKLASVIGRLFRFAHLHAAFPLLDEPIALRSDLDELARLELTPLDTPEPELAYLFKHIVTQEVAYESLTAQARATLHEQYARFVEAQAANNQEPYLDLLALHYDLSEAQAADNQGRSLDLLAFHYDRSENLPKRREYLLRAAEAAHWAYAMDATLDYYTRLLPLLDDPRERIAIHLKVGIALEVRGSFIDMEAHYREALRLAEQIGDAAAQARSQHALGATFQFRGEYAVALSWLEQARAAWSALGDRSELSRVTLMIGRVYNNQGLYAEAIEKWQESVALARDAGNISVIAGGTEFLGIVKARQGDYTGARALYEECLALRRSIDNKDGIAWVITDMGEDAYVQGDYATARALFEESLALFRAIGSKWGIAYMLGHLGEIMREQGDYIGASALLEESLALFRASGYQRMIAETHLLLATVALAQGETATARAKGEEGLGWYRAIGYPRGIAYGTLFLGLLARTEGHVDQAEMCFGDALAQCHTLGTTLEVAIGLACLTVLAADRAAAAQAVRSAQCAARLAGAAAALLETLQAQLIRQFRTPYEGAIATARAMLGDEAFDAAWAAGKQMAFDEAVAFALAPEASAS
jgi:tetratricopeptide (TPR) repeat protein